MIGFLVPLAPSLAERGVLRSIQCGLCHSIGAEYGFAYRALAGPDLVFLDLFVEAVSGQAAPVGTRACVLLPRVSRLPCSAPSQASALASAFGVWMAVAKLRDDWEDEGGLHRWLAWRAFAPGAEKARATLQAQGFPVEEVDRWMRSQQEIERSGPLSLEEASAPTRAIARILFSFAARAGDPDQAGVAGQLGDLVGHFLFVVDNLLDHARDRRAGGYNALAREAGAPAELSPARFATMVERARGIVGELEDALAALNTPLHAGLLRKTLVRGFADKLSRLGSLDPAQLESAKLATILPPGTPWRTRFAQAGSQLGARLGLLWAQRWDRARLMVAMTMLVLFPKTGLAERWWPDGAVDLGLGTGDPALLGASSALPHATSQDGGSVLFDACVGNCGWCDEEGCLSNCNCGGACDNVDCSS